jgi:hypothetical protein
MGIVDSFKNVVLWDRMEWNGMGNLVLLEWGWEWLEGNSPEFSFVHTFGVNPSVSL